MPQLTAGTVVKNPVTGEVVRVLVPATPGTDEPTLSELITRPGGGVPFAHVHPGQDEHFAVVSGRLGLTVDGVERVLEPGESTVVRAGVVHAWRCVGDEPLHARVGLSPGEKLGESIIAFWGLCALGRAKADGSPGFRDGILLAEAYGDQIVLASPPRWVQRLMVRALAPLARLGGRSVTSDEVLYAAVVDPSEWPGSEDLATALADAEVEADAKAGADAVLAAA